jgi:UDP-glucose 4-epimerase
MSASDGLPVTILRFFNVYGPRQAPQYVISQSVYRSLRGERPLLYDGGVATRCFSFVGDVVEAVLLAATSREAVGQVFNIGSDREVSVRRAVELVLESVGSEIGPEPVDTGAHYGAAYEDIPRRIPNVSKARSLLGWLARTPVEEGIPRTVDWARANKWWLE